MSSAYPSTLPEQAQSRPSAHLLSNGRYAALLTSSGGSYSALDGFALTRWSPDPARDADGFTLYLRDVESGERWTAGLQPIPAGAERFTREAGAGRVRYRRRGSDIETTTEVAVLAGRDVEVRRYRIDNRGTTRRTLELTTYAEIVLNTPAGDAGHPAFSKLFVQTGYLPEHRALVAWRRLRSPGDRPLWTAHRLLVADEPAGDPELETDRARFLGRGRSPADPLALRVRTPLSGTLGNVLDPVFSLRRVIEVGPGESVEAVSLLAAAESREALEPLLGDLSSLDAAVAALDAVRPAPEGARKALGLPAAWLEGITVDGSPGGGEEVMELPHPVPTTTRAASVADPARTAADGEGAADEAEDLRLFNGYGGFSQDGTEYVIRVRRDEHGVRLPPLPWVNVIANEEIGFVVSETGAGNAWSANSRENRLTPWFNDPVADPHGEAVYLRDEEDGAFWSPMPGPAPGEGEYEVRHGFGRTLFRHTSRGLEQEVAHFVAPRDPVKVVRVRVTNRSGRPRSLSVVSYAQLVLGGLPCETRGTVETEWAESLGALLARNPDRGEFSERVAFAAALSDQVGEVTVTADRVAFLGIGASLAAPAALVAGGSLDGRTGESLDPCAAFRVPIELAPGETAVCAFLLGEAQEEGFVRAILARHGDVTAVERAGDEAAAYWSDLLGRVRIDTPSDALDLMVNGWLAYQNLSCRMWGRSALYQSGGAFGFRDQLQDSSAMLYLDPAFTRRQIVLHAAHQFVEGDVLHWWHPPTSKGMRTRFSDDLLWLPYITAFYLHRTGDASVLDEEAPFLTARLLEPGEDEVYLTPEPSGEQGSVYEHCCRSLDRSLTKGAHGLPLMGVGDWNDGMNRVGRDGRGESVWLGFFLYEILDDFIPVCEERGDAERVESYRAYQRHLAEVLNDTGWDGGWYRRAYYDNGAPLGSAENDECRIDTIAQAWAVISGAAPEERALQALDAMEAHLVSEQEGLIRLLTPAFDRTPHDPGYIKGYLPGVRENGGQYTHGALWGVRALAEAGRNERAAPLLEMLSPVSHTSTPDGVERYQAEPYVIAADVYGVEPHVGRGGWTWYTGSAGWMLRVALESILGLEIREGEALALAPCIPDDWPGFRLLYRLPEDGTVYRIEVERAPAGTKESGATWNGEPVAVESGAIVVPLRRDGGEHHVRVNLAADVGRRYVPRLQSAAV